MSHQKEFDPSSFDYTFCGNPACENKCGRKMSQRLKKILKENPRPVSWAYFCGEDSDHAGL